MRMGSIYFCKLALIVHESNKRRYYSRLIAFKNSCIFSSCVFNILSL